MELICERSHYVEERNPVMLRWIQDHGTQHLCCAPPCCAPLRRAPAMAH